MPRSAYLGLIITLVGALGIFFWALSISTFLKSVEFAIFLLVLTFVINMIFSTVGVSVVSLNATMVFKVKSPEIAVVSLIGGRCMGAVFAPSWSFNNYSITSIIQITECFIITNRK